ESAARGELPGARASGSHRARVRAELHLRGDLLEQSSPHAARQQPRDGPDPVGQPAPVVLAVGRAVHDRLDGREPLRPCAHSVVWPGVADGGRGVLDPAATHHRFAGRGVDPEGSRRRGPQGQAVTHRLCVGRHLLAALALGRAVHLYPGSAHVADSGPSHRAGAVATRALAGGAEQPPVLAEGISPHRGPTAILSVEGVTFMTDPTFDPAGGDYASGRVTLHKTRGPALAASQVGPVDVVLLSHDQHADNLDRSGRELLRRIPHLITTCAAAGRLGVESIGLESWQSWSIKTPQGATLRVTATPARHGPVGIEPISGEVIGFVISSVERGIDLAYVTGDTVWYAGTREVAERFRPRVVLLF